MRNDFQLPLVILSVLIGSAVLIGGIAYAKTQIPMELDTIVVLTAIFTLVIVVAGLASWQIKRDFKEEADKATAEIIRIEKIMKEKLTRIEDYEQQVQKHVYGISHSITRKDYKITMEKQEYSYGIATQNIRIEQNVIDELKKKDKKDLLKVEKLLIEASELQKDRKEEDAIKKWEAIIEITENEELRKNAWFSIGYLYQNKKEPEHDKAIKAYNNMIENITLAGAYNNRGNAYFYKKEYDEAIESYSKAIELNTTDIETYNNRGIAYLFKESYDNAIKDYNKAIELDPNDALAYSNRGNAYLNKRKYDKAINDHTEAIKLHPSFATAYSNRGAAYASKEDYNNFIRDYQKAQELGLNINKILTIILDSLQNEEDKEAFKTQITKDTETIETLKKFRKETKEIFKDKLGLDIDKL